MTPFDYNAPSELFHAKHTRKRSAPLEYRRFDGAAQAIRFAVEVLRSEIFMGAHLEVGSERFDRVGIRELYDSENYPLVRRTASLRTT